MTFKKQVVLTVSLIFFIATSLAQNQECDIKQGDIVFVMDASSSIGSSNWNVQTKFVSGFTKAFSVSPDEVKFGALLYYRVPEKKFDLKDYLDNDSLSKAILAIKYPKSSGTNTHLALIEVLNQDMFGEVAGGREKAPNILIVITDGLSTSPKKTIQASQKVKSKGMVVVSIGIGNETSRAELEAIASSPELVFSVDDYSVLASIQKDLVEITCDVATTTTTTELPPTTDDCDEETTTTTEEPTTTPDDCDKTTATTMQTTTTTTEEPITTPDDCDKTTATSTQTPTTATEELTTTRRTTTEEPTTTTEMSTTTAVEPTTTRTTVTTTITRPPYPPSTPTPCVNSTQADIIFLIDASTSIGPLKWINQTQFAAKTTGYFSVGRNKVRFGAMIFYRDTVKIFDLKDHISSALLSKALLDIKYPNIPGTFTAKALEEVHRLNMYGTEAGGRDDAPNILLLMTDGMSQNSTATIAAAANLKSADDVTIIAVGIGGSVNRAELQGVASSPKNVFYSLDYSLLDYISRDLVKLTCDIATDISTLKLLKKT